MIKEKKVFSQVISTQTKDLSFVFSNVHLAFFISLLLITRIHFCVVDLHGMKDIYMKSKVTIGDNEKVISYANECS